MNVVPGGQLGDPFDLVACTQRCVDRVTDEKGLKILLMDEVTQEAVSMCCSFTDMLKKDLYLVDALHNSERTAQGHLKALMLVRPTEVNVKAICRELRHPMYAEYHLFFTNALSDEKIAQLAEADDHEVVKQVQEVFNDYYPLHPWAFSCDLELPLLSSSGMKHGVAPRIAESVLSVLLSIRRRPMVRYQGNSAACKAITTLCTQTMADDASLFEFRRSDECLLLIVDRADDIITPLLTQWTYEAMVHAEYGLDKHKTTIQNNGKDEDINLIPDFDQFFRDNLHANWGDLCTNVKNIVDSYREKSDMKSQATDNLEALKAFMDKMPELRKESIMMGKHASIAAALSKEVKDRNLLEVSFLEQEMACSNTQRNHLDRLLELIENDAVYTSDIVRLVLIYTVRWQTHKDAQHDRVASALQQKRTLNAKQEAALAAIVGYGGVAQRASDLFDDERKLSNILRKAVKGLQDVENVYTQHEPVLKKNLQAAFKGTLSTDAFPYTSSSMFSPVCGE